MLGNIFALRSTDPRGLYYHADPIGPENDAALIAIAGETDRVVCGWGAHGGYRSRGADVLAMLRSAGVTPLALAKTKASQPGHPLYIGAHVEPVEFWPW